MSVTWNIDDNNLITFTVIGQLGKAEYDQIQDELSSVIQNVGQVNILILLKDFEGWEKAEGWDDFSSMERNDPYIRKMAIVGDEKWRGLVTAFTLKDLRSAKIEYFASETDETARLWLEAE